MSCSIDIDDRGLGTVGIADADGVVRDYRIRSFVCLRKFTLTRVDTGSTYAVELSDGGKGTCDCPAEKYRKRGSAHCKHLAAMHSFRAFLGELLPRSLEAHTRSPTTVLSGKAVGGFDDP